MTESGSAPAAVPEPAAAGPAARPSAPRTLWWGVLVLLAALVLIGGRSFVANSQHHAWDPDAIAPGTVTLSAGHDYTISTTGGVRDLVARLGSVPILACTATFPDGSSEQLTLKEQFTDERVLHAIATFTAPADGPATVSCRDLEPVFVDDADGRSRDTAGLLTVLVAGLFLLGVALALSGAYRYTTDYRYADGGYDDGDGDDDDGDGDDSDGDRDGPAPGRSSVGLFSD